MPKAKKSEAVARLNAFTAQVRAQLGPDMGSILPSAWLRAMSLAKRVYGLTRRLQADELVEAAARAGATTVGKGLTEKQAVDTVHISLDVQGCGFPRERVESLLHEAVSAEALASPKKQPLVKPEIRVVGTKNVTFQRKAISLSDLEEETALESFTRRRATAQLRFALAPHQPVVKKCVALRLCHHKSYKALAEELGLSTEQVADILSRMRGWVMRFTTYFEHDWYWQEGVIDLPGSGMPDKVDVQSAEE